MSWSPGAVAGSVQLMFNTAVYYPQRRQISHSRRHGVPFSEVWHNQAINVSKPWWTSELSKPKKISCVLPISGLQWMSQHEVSSAISNLVSDIDICWTALNSWWSFYPFYDQHLIMANLSQQSGSKSGHAVRSISQYIEFNQQPLCSVSFWAQPVSLYFLHQDHKHVYLNAGVCEVGQSGLSP